MSGLHLLVVSVELVREGILQEVAEAIREGTTNAGGKVIWAFKVVGEACVVAVLDGGVEEAFSKVMSSCGAHAQMKCTALCSYEEFARKVLGVDSGLAVPSQHQIGEGGQLYWVHAIFQHPGMTSLCFLDVWRREAVRLLQMRQLEGLKFDSFKVVARKEVHCFMRGETNEDIDEFNWKVPIVKEMGAQTSITIKSLTTI